MADPTQQEHKANERSAAEITSVARQPSTDLESKRGAKGLNSAHDLANLEHDPEISELAGRPPDPAPKGEMCPADGTALLDRLVVLIRRHVVFADELAGATALWAVHTHCIDAFEISPRLAIESPVMGCGKTCLLELLHQIVSRPLSTVNISSAALFRTIEATKPTLLIDEGDTFISKNEALRGILNSGHRRTSAAVIRADGPNHEPRAFSTWAPAAFASIGPPPDTLKDRAIRIRLQRRRPDEAVTPLNTKAISELEQISRIVVRWSAANFQHLRETDPILPSTLANRAADNWRPLLAIADVAGGPWPERARQIAEKIAADNADTEPALSIMLLDDIRTIITECKSDRISSAELVKALTNLEGRPWTEFRHRGPINQYGIAHLLAPFDVRPVNAKYGLKVLKSYKLDQFADVFRRYL